MSAFLLHKFCDFTSDGLCRTSTNISVVHNPTGQSLAQRDRPRVRLCCIPLRSRCDNQGLKDRGCKGAVAAYGLMGASSIVRVEVCEATTLLKALVAFKESASPEEPASCMVPGRFFFFLPFRSAAFALGLPVGFAAITGRTRTAARRGSALIPTAALWCEGWADEWSSACVYACVRTMAVPGCPWVQGVGLQGAAALHEGQRWLSVNEDTATKQCKCTCSGCSKALSWAERIAFVCFSFRFVLRSSLPDHVTFAFARPGIRQSGRQVPESA